MRALVWAEWTKFRSARGRLLALAAAVVLPILLAVGNGGAHGSCQGDGCQVPTGPDGELVADGGTFAHRPLTGDGSITVRVAGLTERALPDDRPATVPWAKAGIIVRTGTAKGASYAAIMLTGTHGVRFQHDFVHDSAGLAGSGPRWLRLTRTGSVLTGEDSLDGVHWTKVGAARLGGLGTVAVAGLLAASPDAIDISQGPVSSSLSGGPAVATAIFDHLAATGGWGGTWTATTAPGAPGGFQQAGDVLTVSGSGDLAPVVPPAGIGTTVAQALGGTFVALLVLTVLGAVFMTSEYRHGMIQLTLAAEPRRGRVLAAKAVVVGVASFVAGLAGTAGGLLLGVRMLRSNGVYVYPMSAFTEARVLLGTALVMALAAVLALGLGTLVRRGPATVALVVGLVVLPYLAALMIPDTPGRWLLRTLPAAAFAVQQTVPVYHQVQNAYSASFGYFPLAPWAGLAVLAGWTLAMAGLGARALLRRDA